MTFQRGQRFGRGVDRGRGTHGAKWCFITDRGEMLDYKQLREQHADPKGWTLWLKGHPDYKLFKSRKEAKRYLSLQMAVRAGVVRGLDRQKRIPCLVRNPEGLLVEIGVYTVDFIYEERDVAVGAPWVKVYEDVKGYAEDLYKWKKRHVEAQLGITIRET